MHFSILPLLMALGISVWAAPLSSPGCESVVHSSKEQTRLIFISYNNTPRRYRRSVYSEFPLVTQVYPSLTDVV